MGSGPIAAAGSDSGSDSALMTGSAAGSAAATASAVAFAACSAGVSFLAAFLAPSFLASFLWPASSKSISAWFRTAKVSTESSSWLYQSSAPFSSCFLAFIAALCRSCSSGVTYAGGAGGGLRVRLSSCSSSDFSLSVSLRFSLACLSFLERCDSASWWRLYAALGSKVEVVDLASPAIIFWASSAGFTEGSFPFLDPSLPPFAMAVSESIISFSLLRSMSFCWLAMSLVGSISPSMDPLAFWSWSKSRMSPDPFFLWCLADLVTESPVTTESLPSAPWRILVPSSRVSIHDLSLLERSLSAEWFEPMRCTPSMAHRPSSSSAASTVTPLLMSLSTPPSDDFLALPPRPRESPASSGASSPPWGNRVGIGARSVNRHACPNAARHGLREPAASPRCEPRVRPRRFSVTTDWRKKSSAPRADVFTRVFQSRSTDSDANRFRDSFDVCNHSHN